MSYVDQAIAKAKAMLSKEEDFTSESNQNNMLILGIVAVLFLLVLMWFFGSTMYYGTSYILFAIWYAIMKIVYGIMSVVGF